jgi:hypothetical protein
MQDDFPENELIYQERYCAFIDILGFREIISRLNEGHESALSIATILREVHEPKQGVKNLQNIDLRVQSISDAVAISAAPTPEGLAQLFLATDVLITSLLRFGFFIRGAVAKGRLYHHRNMIFGEALVRAYHFESQIARYARLLVTSKVNADINAYLKDNKYAELFEDRVRQSEDGPYFSNSLRDLAFAASLIDAKTFPKTAVGHDLIAARENIQRRLDEAVDNPNHFEKVRWFALYWNSVMPNTADMPHFRVPGLLQQP